MLNRRYDRYAKKMKLVAEDVASYCESESWHEYASQSWFGDRLRLLYSGSKYKVMHGDEVLVETSDVKIAVDVWNNL